MDEQQSQPQPQPFDDHDIEALGSPATPDALRQIVARHQRTRTRTLGSLLAVALVAGPLTGWAIGHAGGGGTQVSTASQPAGGTDAGTATRSAAAGSAVSGQSLAIAGPDAPKGQHLFSRTTTDGITIRAYRMDPPPAPPAPPANESPSNTAPGTKTQEAPCPAPEGKGVRESVVANANSGASAVATAESGSSAGGAPPAPADGNDSSSSPPQGAQVPPMPPCGPLPAPCKTTPSVLADVSNDAAVGQGFAPIDDKQPTEALSHVSPNGFGFPEGSPATFVTVQTGAGVAKVRLRLASGATDEMAPVSGIAVLAHGSDARPPEGTVEALDGDGKVLASSNIAQPQGVKAIACAYAGPGVMGRATAPPPPRPASPPTTR